MGLFWVGVKGWDKQPPCLSLKLVIIMPQTSNLARKYTNICSFRKYTFYYQDSLNFVHCSSFLPKNLCNGLKSEILPSKSCPISGDWGKLMLAWMFLINCYWMLQNARNKVFTISELLSENQHEERRRVKLVTSPHPTTTTITTNTQIRPD